MGLFSFTQEIAMDLGTANTIIITNGKIVVDEPSVVALDRRTEKMIAVGEKAKLMHEKTHENIRTIRPLRDGVDLSGNFRRFGRVEELRIEQPEKGKWCIMSRGRQLTNVVF